MGQTKNIGKWSLKRKLRAVYEPRGFKLVKIDRVSEMVHLEKEGEIFKMPLAFFV